MTVLLELLTAPLECLDFFDRFVQSAAVEASSSPQNASIIPDIPIMLKIMLAKSPHP